MQAVGVLPRNYQNDGLSLEPRKALGRRVHRLLADMQRKAFEHLPLVLLREVAL